MSWSEETSASWYELEVAGQSSWWKGADVCSSGVCTVDPGVGPDSWRVRGRNLRGYGVWSDLVDPVNQPPIAARDRAITTVDVAVVIDVLANDSDPDGTIDPTSVTTSGGPANGSIVDDGTGMLTYTPDPGFSGSDRFRYRVADNEGELSVSEQGRPWTVVSIRIRAAP